MLDGRLMDRRREDDDLDALALEEADQAVEGNGHSVPYGIVIARKEGKPDRMGGHDSRQSNK